MAASVWILLICYAVVCYCDWFCLLAFCVFLLFIISCAKFTKQASWAV